MTKTTHTAGQARGETVVSLDARRLTAGKPVEATARPFAHKQPLGMSMPMKVAFSTGLILVGIAAAGLLVS